MKEICLYLANAKLKPSEEVLITSGSPSLSSSLSPSSSPEEGLIGYLTVKWKPQPGLIRLDKASILFIYLFVVVLSGREFRVKIDSSLSM